MTKVVAAVSGAILGALLVAGVWVYRVPSVHAQANLLRVQRASIGNVVAIIGTDVVGFSCTTVGTEVQCYFAVR